MRLVLFEDRTASDLGPVSVLRPSFEVVCGRFCLRERLLRLLEPQAWAVLVRDHLAECYREQHPSANVNDLISLQEGPTLLVNGQWLPEPDSFECVSADNAGVIGNAVAWLLLDPAEASLLTDENWQDEIPRIARTRTTIDAGGGFVRYPWDVISANSEQLTVDYGAFAPPRQAPASDHVVVLGPENQVCVARHACVDPFVVLDATRGPIWIEDDAQIQSFTRIEGPCYIGRGTQVFRALIRAGTTIGPACRAGGEIEACVLHEYVNKYHEGFLGHSYVCPWVNLGALTTNSNLKNDYSTVHVPLQGESIDTDCLKVGCFIGDHTRTAIDSMFNTGSSIGIMSMVLPSGELLPKHIPSFSRVWHGKLEDPGDIETGIRTARSAMSRRGCELTESGERLIRYLYHLTAPEREAALVRAARRSVTSLHGAAPPQAPR